MVQGRSRSPREQGTLLHGRFVTRLPLRGRHDFSRTEATKAREAKCDSDSKRMMLARPFAIAQLVTGVSLLLTDAGAQLGKSPD
jgi:hypothetical protein